jgi:hypothetical protein
MLDASAYILACGSSRAVRQAGFTFAVGRHAVGDLSNIFRLQPHPPPVDRLEPSARRRLWELASGSGLLAEPPAAATGRLAEIRAVYEPYLQALSEHLLMDLPPWVPAPGASDNWETTAWDFASPLALLGPNTPFTRDEAGRTHQVRE